MRGEKPQIAQIFTEGKRKIYPQMSLMDADRQRRVVRQTRMGTDAQIGAEGSRICAEGCGRLPYDERRSGRQAV